MARDFQIFGPALVAVNFGAHVPLAQGARSRFSQLGLAEEAISVSFRQYYDDVLCDAYGGKVPIDQQYLLNDCFITTNLVHWDADIMALCQREAQGGGVNPTGNNQPGALAQAGLPMGGGALPATPGVPFTPASGYHYVSLNILPSTPGVLPYRFPASLLTTTPTELPLGTEKSVISCTWRAIPYGVVANGEINVVDVEEPNQSGEKTTTSGPLITLNIGTAVSITDLGLSFPPIFLYDRTADGSF